MKKLLIILGIALYSLFLNFGLVNAQEDKILINVFKRDDCVHCIAEKEFLGILQAERNDIEVKYYDINEEENKKLWEQVAELEKISKVTPITTIGYNLIVGFDEADTTGRQFKEILDNKDTQRISIEKFIEEGGSKAKIDSGSTCVDPNVPCVVEPEPIYVKLPFVGVVNVKEYSLGFLSAILGLLDGFNPCAMWVLVTFMLVLIQIGDKRKMWTIAGIFILAETIMYHLILSLWFTAWDFVGLNRIVTPIVGLLAVGSGAFFLYEWKTGDGTCKVTNVEQKKKISQRIKELASQKFTFFTFLGIIGLAFSVNIIEFACSIGIPQTFTKILEMNALNFWQTEMYLLIYILFYMVDDFLVFGLALYSFEKIGLTQKYAKASNFIGGILMIVLGLILLLKPELLNLI
jgi:cytochrome c biogenesis protein CcdA